MITHEEVKKKWLKNSEFKKGYDALEVEFSMLDALIQLRLKNGLSQEQLAQKLGTKQSAISRMERGMMNPSMGFLRKVAHALGKEVEVKFR